MMKLTKIDVAEAHIKTAVKLHFEEAHPASVLTLANSAREMVASIGQSVGVTTVQAQLAAKRGINIPELVAPLRLAAGFMKHADRTPEATFEFDDNDVDVALHLACHDFGRVTGGMPIEAQVFEAWSSARGTRRVTDMPLSGQQLLRRVIRFFPGIRSADVATQRRLGREALAAALKNPSLQMFIERDVPTIRRSRRGAVKPK